MRYLIKASIGVSAFIFGCGVQSAYLPTEAWNTLVPTKSWDEAAGALTSIDYPVALQLHAVANAESMSTGPPRRSLIRQIGDGQIQDFPGAAPPPLPELILVDADLLSQIDDGQIQAPRPTGFKPFEKHAVKGIPRALVRNQDGTPATKLTCVNPDTLVIDLTDGVIRDTQKRVGAIVANRQFQFDGPPPQAGLLYAKGWSVVNNGKRYHLALGTQTTFYKCSAGNYFNLYDAHIGSNCYEVEIEVLRVVDC